MCHFQTNPVPFSGSSKAAVECFGFIKSALPHAISVLSDKKMEIVKQHESIQQGNHTKKSHVTPSKV